MKPTKESLFGMAPLEEPDWREGPNTNQDLDQSLMMMMMMMMMAAQKQHPAHARAHILGSIYHLKSHVPFRKLTWDPDVSLEDGLPLCQAVSFSDTHGIVFDIGWSDLFAGPTRPILRHRTGRSTTRHRTTGETMRDENPLT